MEKLLIHFNTSAFSEDAYKGFFKAAVFFFISAAVSFSQLGPSLAKQESEYYMHRYELEAKTGKSLEEIDCVKAAELRASCFFAKYEAGAHRSTANLLDMWTQRMVKFGYGALFLSAVAFACHPYFRAKKTADA